MKNKAIIFLASLLALSIFGTVYAAAFVPASEQTDVISKNENSSASDSGEKTKVPETTKSEKIEPYTIRFEAAERMQSPLAGRNAEMLNYKETFNNSIGDFLDIYGDREDNEYLYDPHENFVGWRYSEDKWWNYSLTLDSRYIISEEEAIESAETAAEAIFGNSFDAFTLQQAKLINNSHYWVIFEMQYGENGFLGGAECRVKVLRDGTVVICQMPFVHDYDDFDPTLVADISENMLAEYATQQIHEIYGDELAEYEIEKMCVVKNNGTFQIMIQVDVSLGKPRAYCETLAKVYYDLH